MASLSFLSLIRNQFYPLRKKSDNPKIAKMAAIILKFEQCYFAMHLHIQKMQKE